MISVAQWLADSRSRLATGPPGVPSPTFAKLVEIETSTLLEFTAAAPKLSNDFARISLLRDWIRELTGFEILRRRVTISEWHRELSNLRDELASAVRTILAFEPRPDAPLSEIASALDKVAKIVAETERLDGDTRLASLLGSHFNGSKTDSASLGRVLTFVDGIHDSSLPGEYKAALTSFDSPEAFALIKESLAETLRHDRLLLNHLEELSAACAAEVKDFGPRNASSIQRLLEELDLLSAQAERLGTFIRFKNHTHTCREAGVSHLMDILERDAVLPGVLEKILKWQVMQAKAKGLIESHAILKREGQSLNTVRREYAKLDRECILLQRRVVAHKLVKIPIPQGFNAARVRDKTDLALIKSQIGLHRPSVTVRNLLSRAGGAVMAIKPCFMMGPLSVAQFLARGGLEFDLLVMDEASQMQPEDALGAIARARQVVVVGDSKQLPPTSFFSRTGVGSDEDNPEDATSLEESESILEAAASIFHPSRQLKWHYRSQHESLVAFSNHRFYGGSSSCSHLPPEALPTME